MASRESLIKELEISFPYISLKTTEEFGASPGGIWTFAEGEGDTYGPWFDYDAAMYDSSEIHYVMGVRRDVLAVIEKAGFYPEFNDPGTVMIWPS